MPDRKEKDRARRLYTFRLKIPRRCVTCLYHDGTEPGGECELLGIDIAFAERSGCPLWAHWNGMDEHAEAMPERWRAVEVTVEQGEG